MKKSLKILGIVLICILIIFLICEISLVNRTKQRIMDNAKYLMDSISAEDYDRIRLSVKKANGTELSDQEILNFLLNTELYRATFINGGQPSFTYSTNVNLFNTNKGKILFSYEALNGDIITNELEYVHVGIHEYFITNNFDEKAKEIKKYPFAKDLANGEEIGYNEDNADNKDGADKFWSYRFIQDEDGNSYLEIIEEAKEDIRIVMFNKLGKTLKDVEGKYKFEWNEDCSVVLVYYNSDEGLLYRNNLSIVTVSMLCSITSQALSENPDWHLTINYYDYNTEELLKTEIIR